MNNYGNAYYKANTIWKPQYVVQEEVWGSQWTVHKSYFDTKSSIFSSSKAWHDDSKVFRVCSLPRWSFRTMKWLSEREQRAIRFISFSKERLNMFSSFEHFYKHKMCKNQTLNIFLSFIMKDATKWSLCLCVY